MSKRLITASSAATALLIAGAAQAQETTYTFTGGLYETLFPPIDCVVGECATFTTAQRTTVSLTFAAPLAANLPFANRSADIIAYRWSDGVRSTSGPGPTAAIFDARFGTDAAGRPISPSIMLMRTPGPPYLVRTPADPNSRFSYVVIGTTTTWATANFVCTKRGGGDYIPVNGPGSCNGENTDDSSSVARSNVAPVVTISSVGPPAAVPTLSEWSMILFSTVLAGGAALFIQRRRIAG